MLPIRVREDTLDLADYPGGQRLRRVSLLASAHGLFVHGVHVGVGLFIGGIDHSLRTGRCQFVGGHLQHRR